MRKREAVLSVKHFFFLSLNCSFSSLLLMSYTLNDIVIDRFSANIRGENSEFRHGNRSRTRFQLAQLVFGRFERTMSAYTRDLS